MDCDCVRKFVRSFSFFRELRLPDSDAQPKRKQPIQVMDALEKPRVPQSDLLFATAHRQAFELVARDWTHYMAVLPKLGPLEMVRYYVGYVDPRLVVFSDNGTIECNLVTHQRRYLSRDSSFTVPLNRRTLTKLTTYRGNISVGAADYQQSLHYAMNTDDTVSLYRRASYFCTTRLETPQNSSYSYNRTRNISVHALNNKFCVLRQLDSRSTFSWSLYDFTRQEQITGWYVIYKGFTILACNEHTDAGIYIIESTRKYYPNFSAVDLRCNTLQRLSGRWENGAPARAFSLQCYNNGLNVLLATTGSDMLHLYDVRADRWIRPPARAQIWKTPHGIIRNPTRAFILDK